MESYLFLLASKIVLWYDECMMNNLHCLLIGVHDAYKQHYSIWFLEVFAQNRLGIWLIMPRYAFYYV